MNRPEYLIPALEQLVNAKKSLCYAVSAFNMSGGDFDKTTNEIKQMIGDIECAILELNNR